MMKTLSIEIEKKHPIVMVSVLAKIILIVKLEFIVFRKTMESLISSNAFS